MLYLLIDIPMDKKKKNNDGITHGFPVSDMLNLPMEIPME